MIEHDEKTGAFILYTQDGSRVLGRHDTYDGALEQDRAIQWSKHHHRKNPKISELSDYISYQARDYYGDNPFFQNLADLPWMWFRGALTPHAGSGRGFGIFGSGIYLAKSPTTAERYIYEGNYEMKQNGKIFAYKVDPEQSVIPTYTPKFISVYESIMRELAVGYDPQAYAVDPDNRSKLTTLSEILRRANTTSSNDDRVHYLASIDDQLSWMYGLFPDKDVFSRRLQSELNRMGYIGILAFTQAKGLLVFDPANAPYLGEIPFEPY